MLSTLILALPCPTLNNSFYSFPPKLLEVVYSYWDGSGHRKSLSVKKGTTVGKFLELVKQQIAPEFNEVRSCSSEDFLYIKEDLIIPHVKR